MLRYLDDSLWEKSVAHLDEQLRRDPWLREEFETVLLKEVLLRDIGRENRSTAHPSVGQRN
jgi:hypothetical protein